MALSRMHLKDDELFKYRNLLQLYNLVLPLYIYTTYTYIFIICKHIYPFTIVLVTDTFRGILNTWLPGAIFPSCAAGPSFSTCFTCRNSSGLSPPMMVKPNPIALFFSDARTRTPFSWDGSRVKWDFSMSVPEWEIGLRTKVITVKTALKANIQGSPYTLNITNHKEEKLERIQCYGIVRI